jgi:hypothetical protein
MTMFASPRLALGFGIFIALAETVRRWGNWPFPPFLLDDWIAGIFLVYGAVRSRRNWTTGRPFQAAAWAFMCGLMYGSFFTHLEHWAQPPEGGWIPHQALVVIIGVLYAVALCGLISTLLTTSRVSKNPNEGYGTA